MKFDLTTIELERDDLNTLHDVIIEALDLLWDKGISDEEIIQYWNKLPNDIKLDALKWGVSDTPTKDAIYVWLQENKPI